MRLTDAAGSWLVSALVLASLCLARPGIAESLDGCMGPPAKPTSVSKPTVVFVFRCYAAADYFLAPDPEEADKERDRQLRAQARRLRGALATSGVEVLEASGALNLRFVSASNVVTTVRTKDVDWRGLLIHCPGQSLRKRKVLGEPEPDIAILGLLEACNQPSGQSK